MGPHWEGMLGRAHRPCPSIPFSLVNNIHTRSSLISPGQEHGKTRTSEQRLTALFLTAVTAQVGLEWMRGDGADGSDGARPLSHGLVKVSRLAGLRVRQTVTDRVQCSPCC